MRTRLTTSILALALSCSGTATIVPHLAYAQQRAVDEDHVDLLDRIDDVSDKVQDAQANGDVTRTQASKMRQQLTAMRKSARKMTRQQGLLSASKKRYL